jgi:hypothetical protein
MSGGGSGGTSSVGPPKWQQNYIQQGYGAAADMYNHGGTPVAPQSADTQAALTGTAARATNGSPLVGDAQKYTQGVINGNYLNSNPYLDQTFNRAAMATQGQLASQFAGSGRNIDQSQFLRGQELNDLATGIYGGAYDSERNRQQQAASMATGLANQDYVDLGQLAAVGAQRDTYAQDQANQPGVNLDQYLGRVTGQVGQTSYQPRNTGAGAVGGAMLGNQIGQQYGGQYGGLWGSILGAGIGGWG